VRHQDLAAGIQSIAQEQKQNCIARDQRVRCDGAEGYYAFHLLRRRTHLECGHPKPAAVYADKRGLEQRILNKELGHTNFLIPAHPRKRRLAFLQIAIAGSLPSAAPVVCELPQPRGCVDNGESIPASLRRRNEALSRVNQKRM
jgi:hypothetical protein